MSNDNIKDYKIIDYTSEYKSIMHFNRNKQQYMHRWFPFVEGYSTEFINSILIEQSSKSLVCLDPFSGSGTTALELQKKNIECHSIEVNPFMYLLSSTKLRTNYILSTLLQYFEQINQQLNCKSNVEFNKLIVPKYKSIVEKDGLNKWIFNKNIFNGLMKIKTSISAINNLKYQNLFKIAFSSILLDVSNVYRNGKCVTYKKNWINRIHYSEEEVISLFQDKLKQIIIPDITLMNAYKKIHGKLYSNSENCMKGDAKKIIKSYEDSFFDIVITSPPYLNSRDYTDIYMIELWMLDMVKTYDEVKKLRKKTLRSHVQVKLNELELLEIDLLQEPIEKLLLNKEKLWNTNLINMIKGYFLDINDLFHSLYNKMKNDSTIYFNVANSEYLGIEIEVDKICAEIAIMNGFNVREIRLARYIKHRSKHHDKTNNLRESVLIIEK